MLDIGCGFGDASQELAALVGPSGSVLGVDIAPRFIEAARAEAELAAVANVRFEVHDVQAAPFVETFDYAFSRFGTMFFDNPVPALRNVREAMAPGGRLCIVVWRRRFDNPWLYEAEKVVKPLLDEPEETDEPRCGPGPFSMADADTTSGQLQSAGFADISLRRFDNPLRFGATLDEADRDEHGTRAGSGGDQAGGRPGRRPPAAPGITAPRRPDTVRDQARSDRAVIDLARHRARPDDLNAVHVGS